MNPISMDRLQHSTSDSLFRWDSDRFTQKIISVMGFKESELVLDVGCGSGLFKEGLVKGNGFYVGIDVRPDENWKRYSSANSQFIVCDARLMPFVDKAFDDALSKDVLHHTRQPRQVLLEIVRVASRRAVILEGNRYNPIMFVHMTALLRHAHFKRADFESLIRSVDRAAIFSTAEAHVLPARPAALALIMRFVSGCFEKSRFRSIHSYNIAFLNHPPEFTRP
jgi:ubiquinone/menaquinone biosynthesis C-methylase UbiE